MSLMLALVLAAGQIDAASLTLSAPTAIVEIDVGKLKGDLVRLSWSPDGTQFYLQTSETDRRFNTRLRHFVLGLDGQPPKGTAQEPTWASLYWSKKSSQIAPGVPSLKIEVEQQRKLVSATSNPAGGSLARGDLPGSTTAAGTQTGMGLEDAARAAEQGQMANIVTLRLKGQVIGEFVNAPAIPGLTFSWGPAGTGLVAFADPDGRIVIMDGQGRVHKLSGPKSASLPAWTADGKRLAYLEKTGRNKFTLHVVDVTMPGQ
ncbi:MAG: hypothetical protein AB1806_09815 [Acidobacteriota bacterium]